MPRIPDPSEISRTQLRPSTTVAQPGAVGVESQALANFGGAIVKLAAEELNSINVAKATEAAIRAREVDLELTLGETGYANDKLGAVLPKEGEEPWLVKRMAMYNDKVSAIEDGLSRAQKALFAKSKAAMATNHQSSLMKHAIAESDKYKEQVHTGDVQSNMKVAAINWGNDAPRDSAVEGIRKAFQAQKEQGYAPKEVDARMLGALSTAHTQVIQNMLASGSFGMAKDYFNKNQKEIIDQTISARINQDVEQGTGASIGAAVAQQMMKENPDSEINQETMYASIDVALGEGASRQQKAFARQEADTYAAARRNGLVQRRAAPLQMVLDNKSLAEVKNSAEYGAMNPEGRLYIENQIKARDSGTTEEKKLAHMKETYALVNSPKFTQMTNNEVLDFAQRKQLPASTAAQLIETRNNMANPTEHQPSVDTTMFDNAYLVNQMGTLKNKGQNENYLRTLDYVEGEFAKAQRATGSPLRREVQLAIVNRAMESIKVEKPRWYWPGVGVEEVPRALVGGRTPVFSFEDLSKVDIPPAAREGIIRALGDILPGVVPTESEIRTAYLRANQ